LFEEKVSGARRHRPELERLLGQIRMGDVLVISRLDRPARSTAELLRITAVFTEKSAGLQSLDEPWADTTSPSGRMTNRAYDSRPSQSAARPKTEAFHQLWDELIGASGRSLVPLGLCALVAAAARPDRLRRLPCGILAHVQNEKYHFGFIAFDTVSSDKARRPGIGRSSS
jgi:hypothetical protein